MAQKMPRWAKVCGIGCGAVALIVVLLIASGFFFFRHSLKQFEIADRSHETISTVQFPRTIPILVG
jgi:hypothetical protein